jgi:hypothetical protein
MLRLIRGSFALLAVLLVGLTNAGGSLTIAFVPMYATPVARQLPLMLGAIARIDVREPPRATLGGYIEPGDVSAVAAWLKSPTLRHAGAFIVSTDMVAYGGLDPSRVPGGVDTQLALSRLKLFAALRKTRPHAWIAAFGTIMRLEPTAVAPVGAAASYDPIARYPLWEYILEYAKLHTPPQPDEADRARRLRALIGQPALQAYLATRARDRDVDLHILGMAADHTIDRVVLGQDDAGPVGLHIPDVQALQGAVARLGIADRASIEPGADELGLVLVAHAMAHAAGWTPRVAVRYSMPDGGDVQDPLEFAPISSACDALIRLAGAVRNELDPDIILYVRVPNTDGIHDAALLHELSAETAAGKSVALVDLSFLSGSYEPQARFVRRLIRAGVAAKLDAYASWNTNANSTGIALAEAIAAGVGRRTGRYDPTAHADFMVDRYLDDFLYHDLVRPRLNDYLTARGVSDHTYLAPDVWADANRRLRLLLEPLAHDLIAHLYPNYRVARLSISLPWPRTFEMETDVRLTAKPS